jgi:alpha-beta hydrolase superfamily lysophospholipase
MENKYVEDIMKDITIKSSDGKNIHGYTWYVDSPKAVVVIVHGMAEHSARYDRFAKELNSHGMAAMSIDLRGHGKTAEIQGYFAKKDGWKMVIEDIRLLVEKAKSEHPNLPVLMFGHSMGSIFARASMMDFGAKFDACVLSGVTISKKGLRDVAPFMAKLFSLFGAKKPSKTLDSMTFGQFNNAFQPNRSTFDWLSRDEAEVDKYIEDEMCGFVCTPSLFHDVSKTLLYTLDNKNVEKIPKSKKIFIVSGAKDPCGSDGIDAKYLYDSYKGAGLDVEYKVYENARHELLNETNREDITRDIINFLEISIE